MINRDIMLNRSTKGFINQSIIYFRFLVIKNGTRICLVHSMMCFACCIYIKKHLIVKSFLIFHWMMHKVPEKIGLPLSHVTQQKNKMY